MDAPPTPNARSTDGRGGGPGGGVLARARRTLASSLRPPLRSRPSQWARERLRLTPEMGAQQNASYDPDYFPWTREMLDIRKNHPEHAGVIYLKCSQIGVTTTEQIRCAEECEDPVTRGLFLIGRESEAKSKVTKLFDPICQQAGLVFFTNADEDRRSRPASSSASARRRGRPHASRPTGHERRFLNGASFAFHGAGSPSSVASNPYNTVTIDEFDIAESAFPDKWGSLWDFAVGRLSAQRFSTWMTALGHPTVKDDGIHRLYHRLSDEGAWAFDCPHCDKAVAPDHKMIAYHAERPDGTPDPGTAYLKCPSCGAEITEAERIEAVWPASDRHPNGTGRRHTSMPEEHRRTRQYLGFAINGMCNPYKTIVELATLLLDAKTDDARQGVLNVQFGEVDDRTKTPITADHIKAAIETMPEVVLPGGSDGVLFMTVGIDVQPPYERPIFYVAGIAFARSGYRYVALLERVQGWHALRLLLRNVAFPVREREYPMCPLTVGIDDRGVANRKVLDFLRDPIRSAATKTELRLLGVGFESGMGNDPPIRPVTKESRLIKPGAEHLGKVERWELHRHTWVDRVANDYHSKVIKVICEVPEDFVEHCTANQLRELPRRHGQERKRAVWTKPDGYHDDWFMAMVYATAVAEAAHDLSLLEHEAFGLGDDVKVDGLVYGGEDGPISAPTWGEGGDPMSGYIDEDPMGDGIGGYGAFGGGMGGGW